MANGTYQQSGPSAPQAARAVLAEIGSQQKAFGALPAQITIGNLVVQAKATGSAGEAVTVATVVDGDSEALSVTVSSNAITVHLASDAAGNPISTAGEVRDAINGTADASALVSAAVEFGTDPTRTVPAQSATALSGDTAAVSTGVDGGGSIPFPKQHPQSNSYR